MAPKLWVLTLLLMTAAGKRLIARDNGSECGLGELERNSGC